MGHFTRFTNFHPLQRLDPDRRARVGFAAGSVIAILTAAGIFTAVHLTNAEPFVSDGSYSEVTAPADNGQAGSFGGTSEPVTNPQPHAPAPAPATVPDTNLRGSYAALGDSVAAGLGLPLVANATSLDTTCGRSSQAYGYEVGRQLNLRTRLAACSGATAGDLLTQQGVSGANPQAQLTTAYAYGTPSLISITAGANDTAWLTFVRKCYTTACGTDNDQTAASAAIALARTKLVAAMASIQLRASASGTQPPRVVLTGYYQPFSERCLNVPAIADQVSQAELDWLRGNVDALNSMISDVAGNYRFARFAPVNFDGHDICSTDPWVQGLGDAAPVHPTAAGQQAIARSVVNAAR